MICQSRAEEKPKSTQQLAAAYPFFLNGMLTRTPKRKTESLLPGGLRRSESMEAGVSVRVVGGGILDN